MSINRLRQQLINGEITAEEFFKFTSKVFTYAFNEITDLYYAKPDLTAVATYAQWLALGYPVKKGEKGIALQSVRLGTNRDGTPSYKRVFDVSQTRAPKRYGRFIYAPDALPYIKQRFSQFSGNEVAADDSKSAYWTIRDFVYYFADKSFGNYEHKSLVAECAELAVLERLGLLSSTMQLDEDEHNEIKSIASDPEQFEVFGRYFAGTMKTALMLARQGVRAYEKDDSVKREPLEREINDRSVFAETAEKLYRYRAGEVWHIVKVANIYTNNKGVQIYTLCGVKGDRFRVTLGVSDFERLAQEVIIDDNSPDLAEQVTDKPEAPVVVITPPIKTSAVADFKDSTDELFNRIDDFSAREIEGFVKDHIETTFFEDNVEGKVIDLAIYGSRSRGLENPASDLDVVVEIKSDLKEDALFNILHETEFTVGEVTVDINPIRAEESGTLAEYLPRAEKYLAEKEKTAPAVDVSEPEQIVEADEDILAYANQVAQNAAEIAPAPEDTAEPESVAGLPKGVTAKHNAKDYTRRYKNGEEQQVFPITNDMFDHVLRCGSAKSNSVYHIINQFSKGASLEENTAFLKEHFKGFTVGYIVKDTSGLEAAGYERRITALFDENRIEIHAGTSTDNMFASAFFSYENAAESIARMLSEGTYRPQADLDKTYDAIRRDLASRIYFTNREIEDKEYSIVTSDLSWSAPEAEEQIYSSMSDLNTVREYGERTQRLADRFAVDNSVVRFDLEGRRAPELAAALADYIIPRRTFTAKEGFEFAPRYFVPNNMVDRLTRNLYYTTKFKIVEEYERNKSVKPIADYLKGNFGITGSSSSTGYSYFADSKGIEYWYNDGMRMPDTQREILLVTYPELAARTAELIENSEYITADDTQSYIRGLTEDVRLYWTWKDVTYTDLSNRPGAEETYLNKIETLKGYGIDTDALIERVKAELAEERASENEIPEEVTAEVIEEQPADVQPDVADTAEPIIIEADEAPEMTPEEAESEELSQDDLIAFANQVAETAAEEAPAPENEQLSFFNFAAPAEKPEPTKYFILFQLNGRTVAPLIREYKDSAVDWDGIAKNEGYVYGRYGENKTNAQNELARIRALKARGEFDEDYYMSLIPSALQEQYKEKVANRHLPIIYTVDESGHIKVKDPYAEMAATLSGRNVNVVYDDANDSNIGTVTYQGLWDIEQYKDRFAAAGYYAISEEEFNQQSKVILSMTKVGDMWEMYGDDARTAAEVIGLTVLRKGADVMIGFPDFVRDTYAKQLESAGYGIATQYPAFSGRTSKVVNATANIVYEHLNTLFPAFMSQDYRYMRFTADGYEPLSLDWVGIGGDKIMSIAHTYTLNGDLMDDPEIRLYINDDTREAFPVSYSNSGLGLYKEYEVGDKNSRDCNAFMVTWLNNLDHQPFALSETIRENEAGEDIRKSYDRPEDEPRHDLDYVRNEGSGYDVVDLLNYKTRVAVITQNNIDYYAEIPDYYKREIERYAKREKLDIELFNAIAIVTFFEEIQNGRRDLGEVFDLTRLVEVAEESKYIDREIKGLISDIAAHSPLPAKLNNEELEYVISTISTTLDDVYISTGNRITDDDIRYILDNKIRDKVFNNTVVQQDMDKVEEAYSAPEIDIDETAQLDRVYQVITDAGLDGGIDDKSEYSSPDTASAIGRDFIKNGYLGYCVYNTNTQRIIDIGGDFTLYKAFSPEILRENGYYEEAAQAQALMASESIETPAPEEEQPAPGNENVYDFKEGDTVEVLGSDRQFVVTKINETDKTVEVRDDNTGWYPLFQELPFEHINSLTDKTHAERDMVDSLTAPTVTAITEVENGEAVDTGLVDYVIDNDDLGVGTPRERLAANIAAIELIRKLESEHRYATPEEQKVLAGYVGWGSLADVFDERKDNYLSDREKIQGLLSEQEYERARESTLTAFYTQPLIVRSIYRALSNMGFEGGKVLEPAMGVGNFFGMMPENIRRTSCLYGVELDTISGYISKQLYQNADISIKGYEDTRFADNSFDVVVGNVPFGDFKVFDTRYDKHNLLIHDYYFIKSLDKVKPGGVVAFITSKGTMDKKDSKVRRMMCERAELLGAVRLPYTAFKGNAGTEVISDIIFLKKRESISSVREDWIDVEYSPEASAYVNKYFLNNPDMVCGTISTQSTQFGYDLNVLPFEDISLEDALNERIDKIEGKYEPVVTKLDVSSKKESDKVFLKVIDDSIPDYCFGTTPNGDIVYREGDTLEVISTSNQSRKQYLAFIRLSRAARYIINIQQEIPDDKAVEQNERDFEAARLELNQAYDAITKLGLVVNPDPNKRVQPHIKSDFARDRNYPLMCSLENSVTDANGVQKWVKGSPLFDRRTIVKRAEITHCDTITDAYMVCLNTKTRVDLNYISQLTDKPIDEIISELNGSYIYRNPDTADANDITTGWETSDEYLSGNIRYKLQRAKEFEIKDKSYEKNTKALENVLPAWLSAADIKCQLGCSWIPTEYISDFMEEVLELPLWCIQRCEVDHDLKTATWRIDQKSYSMYSSATKEVYGTPDMNGLEVLEHSLNRMSCKIYDRVRDEDGIIRSVLNPKKTAEIGIKQDELNRAFENWIYKDPYRAKRLEEIYNNLFNAERVRRFDGSFLTFDGMNVNVQMQEHQKNAVARILFGGNALLAHVVGAGKTYEIAAACMELKRVGAASKSLIVVPNHLIGQWQKEFLTLYPAANILAATTADFAKDNRKRFMARIATGDYDAIIMGYSTFSKIGISKARRKQYYTDEIDGILEHLQEVESRSLTEKMLQRAKKQLEASLKSLEYTEGQDEELTFEELGVDRLFIDEAHNFKNLQTLTKLGNVKGLQTTRSKRAEDLLLKIRYLTELQGTERGVVLATGTPISNSMVEMFTMQRYLQPSYLEQKGLGHFDAWISNFGSIEKVIELKPTGVGFRMTKRCAKFNNLPELMIMYNRIADIQTAEMLNLPIPKLKDGKYNIEVCSPSPEQKAFIASCGERAELVYSGHVDPSVDNMLKITNDGKMCALDHRLIDPDAEDRPDSKVNRAIQNIYNKWQETTDKRLTQIVFLDKSTPKTDGSFNLYDDIRNKLVEKGVPKEEIAFIHEAKNDREKLQMFDDVNSGKIRIILGSTEKMGAGTNIQTRLCALHHIDVPWRPSDIEQREGRILRRGNLNDEVEIFRYVTEQTFDAYSWQTIENKQRFIAQVMTGEAAGRSAEDVDSAVFNYAQIKSLATGDERIKEHFDLKEEVTQLKMLKGSFEKAHIAMRDRLTFDIPKELQKETHFVKTFKAEVEYAKTCKPFNAETKPFNVTFCGTTYDKREDAGNKIYEIIKSGAAYNTEYPLGDYRGYALSVTFSAASNAHVLILRHNDFKIETLESESPIGMTIKLDNLIDKEMEKLLVAHSEKLAALSKEKESCEKHFNDVFDREQELIDKEKRLNELSKALSFDEASDKNADMLDDTDDNIIGTPDKDGRK